MDLQEVVWTDVDCIDLALKRDGLAGYCEYEGRTFGFHKMGGMY
jgi:hypothetical protein